MLNTNKSGSCVCCVSRGLCDRPITHAGGVPPNVCLTVWSSATTTLYTYNAIGRKRFDQKLIFTEHVFIAHFRIEAYCHRPWKYVTTVPAVFRILSFLVSADLAFIKLILKCKSAAFPIIPSPTCRRSHFASVTGPPFFKDHYSCPIFF